MDVARNGTTPEQEALRHILYGEGGLESARRIIAGATLQNLPKVIEQQTREKLALGRKAGVADIEITDHIAESVADRRDMEPDELHAIFNKVASESDGIRHNFGNNFGKIAVPNAIDPPETTLRATSYEWQEPASIPPRQWLYGAHYVRRYVTTTVAPGGTGKSSLALVEAIAMVTSLPLLGFQPRKPLKVWYWNGEDPLDEIDRRIAAICKHFNIDAARIGGRLYRDSGRDAPIIVARRLNEQTIINVPIVESVTQELLEKQIDCLILDPFVSTHGVPKTTTAPSNRLPRHTPVSQREQTAQMNWCTTPASHRRVTAEIEP